MRARLVATALLGSGSIVTVATALITAKVWAVLFGPAGYGEISLLQSSITLMAIVAEMGIGAALVREGAPLVGDGSASAGRLWRASAGLVWIAAGLTALMMVVFRESLARALLENADKAHAMVWCAFAVVFSVASTVRTAILNAHHRVAALTRSAMVQALLSAPAVLTIGAVLGLRSISVALAVGAFVRWAVVVWFLKRETGIGVLRPEFEGATRDQRKLIHFGVPYAASVLAGVGVQTAVPFLVLRILDRTAVGFYQASVAISIGALGFVFTALGQDYYPRVAACPADPASLGKLVNEQHRLVMLVSIPAILMLKATLPWVIPVLYSADFMPTLDVLRWHLTADLLKFSSWTLSFVVLARMGSLTYFLAELTAGVTTLVAMTFLGSYFGLEGLGQGLLVTYAVYWLVIWGISRRRLAFVWDGWNLAVLGAGVLAATMPGLVTPIVGVTASRILEIATALAGAALAGRQLIRIARTPDTP